MPSIKDRKKVVENEIKLVNGLLRNVDQDKQVYYQLRKAVLENRLIIVEILERLKF